MFSDKYNNINEVNLNKPQYIRLSIVLAIPALVISFWLPQQDFDNPRKQLVQCSISRGDCYLMRLTTSGLNDVVKDKFFIRYNALSSDHTLGLYDLDVPINVYFENIDNGAMLDVSSLVNGKTLEMNGCILEERDLICGTPLLSFITSNGRMEFINSEDEATFNNVIKKGETYFEDDTLILIAMGLGYFLAVAVPYLIFSWLVHFIIYGAKRGSQKKRPYQ